MWAFREEIKKKDDEFLTKQHEFEARIQEVEAWIRQEMDVGSHPGEKPNLALQGDEDMELITDVAAELSLVVKKQKAKSSEDSNQRNIKVQKPAARQHTGSRVLGFENEVPHTSDVEMDSDANRQRAGTSQRDTFSSQPVVGQT